MEFREVSDADNRLVIDGVRAMSRARTLDDATKTLVHTAIDLVPCDHGGYSEIDEHFGRTRMISSEPEVEDWVKRKAAVWQHFMPTHPVLRYRNANPDVAVVRLSDVTNLKHFYNSGLYHELFREVETSHQLLMHLGTDPRRSLVSGVLPLNLGVPLNRKGHNFSRRDMQVLTMLQRIARPVLSRQRAKHQFRLMEAAELSAELLRKLMGFGLTERQAEVTFWILKGKSNTDIGTILDIGAQTVRQHTIEIYRRFDTRGRMALQRVVLKSILDID